METKEVELTEFFNTSKVINELAKGAVKITGDADPHVGWEVFPVGKKDLPATVAVRLSCRPDDKKLIKQTLSVFDRDIMDAIYSLYHDGKEDVTPSMIIRAYAGNPKKDSTEDFQKKVEDTMDKLASLTIRINCEDQFKMMGMSTTDNSCIFEGLLMPVEKTVTQGSGGKDKIGYHLLGTPVLYKYALKLKHICGVPAGLLNIPGKRTNKEATMIARYLIRRIAAMKNKKNNVNINRIAYERKKDEGMFRVLGVYKKGFKNLCHKKCELHKTVVRYLDHFEKLGYISGYVVLKKKRSVYGVEIET